MRNGGIGAGWYPEELLEVDEVKVLAEDMLREKLKSIFDIMQEKYRAAQEIEK